MFGYIVMNKPEIKFKDFDLYRSFYCGLCRELKSKYGISGQISLTYDMTFVVILLSALYEPPTQKGSTRCIIHPVCKQPVRRNTVTEYAASRATQTACHICQAQLHTIIITACRHTSKRILHLLIPVSSAFHLLQNHLILYIIRFQTDSLLNIIQCIYVISKSHVCHGRQIIPLSVPL